jgi:RNA polymerase-binding transcription factor DksA
MTRDVAMVRERLVSLVDEVLSHYRSIDPTEISPLDQKHLAELVDAFDRLDSGTYGKCVSCGAYLGSERLLEEPAQSLCPDCEVENTWRPFAPR